MPELVVFTWFRPLLWELCLLLGESFFFFCSWVLISVILYQILAFQNPALKPYSESPQLYPSNSQPIWYPHFSVTSVDIYYYPFLGHNFLSLGWTKSYTCLYWRSTRQLFQETLLFLSRGLQVGIIIPSLVSKTVLATEEENIELLFSFMFYQKRSKVQTL